MSGKMTRRALGVVAAALLWSGCATVAEYPDTSRARDVTIVVDNTNTANSSLTVDLLSEFGARERLGTVRMNEKKSFTVKRTKMGGNFRLVADPLGGERMFSHTFALNEGDRVAWDLHMNSVFFQGNRRLR